MKQNAITLKSINDLLGKKFYVPAYQRGYRWKPQQVKDLLNDIWEFHQQENKSREEFYCLQPVVVAQKEDEWILIDGQQRLTTLYLILTCLDDLMKITRKKNFSIRFETRSDSSEFLEHIDPDKKQQNIDYFHICEAKDAIEAWFDGKDGTHRFHFLNTLLNDDETGRNVKVIWYEIGEDANHIDIFTRINMGKIRLTNAELIKALFLQEGNFTNDTNDRMRLRQMQIAGEWDSIEYTLQNDAFWYFIHDNSRQYATRIELIFDLMKSKTSLVADEYYTFHQFHNDFAQGKDLETLWKEIKDYFMTFEAWYNDRVLYHLIGFLVAHGTPIPDMISPASKKTKTAFKAFLQEEIKKKVTCQIDTLEYGDNKIKPVLLLFNIQTILDNEKSSMRFPFDLFKKENWDIEHIRSVKSDKPSGDKQRKWLEDILEYFTDNREIGEALDTAIKAMKNGSEKELSVEIRSILQTEKRFDTKFDVLYDKVLAQFKENDEPENINSISNLALLDERTNRSYKNAVFPVKRKTILANDKNGTFVPICTKNVFLKYYSRNVSDMMHWNNSDATDYVAEVKNTLRAYLPELTIEIQSHHA